MKTTEMYEMLQQVANIARRCAKYEDIFQRMTEDASFYAMEMANHRSDPNEVKYWKERFDLVEKYLTLYRDV